MIVAKRAVLIFKWTLLTTIIQAYSGDATKVFQGDCSADKVLCEQLCITLSEVTYECSCWQDHVLQDDGLSCRVNTDVQYSEERNVSTLTSSPTSTLMTTTRDSDEEDEDDLESVDIDDLSSEKPSSKSIRSLKRTRVLKSKALSFKGSNYAEFPIEDDAYLETNITLQFKLKERKDGILLFAGQLVGDDFLSITIDGPNIVMRHDCGEGTIEDMYHGSYAVGEWHEVNVWRRNCDRTQMRVDNGRRLVDVADEFKNYKGITMDEGVFIGGAPRNIQYLSQKAGTDDGIVGCIRKLIINDRILLDDSKKVNKALDVASLYYCSSEKTIEKEKNETENIEMYDLTQHGLPRIQEEIEQLAELAKEENATRYAAMMLETTTVTTTSTEVPTTEVVEPVVVPKIEPSPSATWKVAHFNGSSRLSVPAPNDILSYLELAIQFKTESPSGLLFYWVEGKKFLAVVLEESFVKVYASLGADATVLRSENVISLYHWHKLEVWRSGKGILLKINRQNWVESELHGERMEVEGEDKGSLHVGGYDGNLPSVMRSVEGFEGCVKRIRLNGRPVIMSAKYAQGVSECSVDPCASFGCPSSCIAHNSLPICECSWPTIGQKCQQKADYEISSMAFSGFSYLRLNDEAVMSHITGDKLNLAVNFKLRNHSTHLNQILAATGEPSQDNDFFELSVDQNRMARFAVNLGQGTVVLTHPKRIEDERWTTVEVIRKKREVTLSVNGEDPITALADEGAEQLNVYRDVFIGGEPQPTSESTEMRRSAGLHGCIISIRFDQTVISHPKHAISAINIGDCAI